MVSVNKYNVIFELVNAKKFVAFHFMSNTFLSELTTFNRIRIYARKGIKFDNPDDSYEFFDKNRPLILNLKPMVEIIEETKSSILKGITNEK